MSNLEVGIVGLPNVGKSTLFNAITKAGAEAANFPFCTIEPNVGVVAVPDPRLKVLHELYNSKKTTPASVRFVDIAGLVKGASKGEGLGNKFLEHIRQVDAVAHVVRCFVDPNITHVEGGIDPLRDIDIIQTELCLADLEIVEKRIMKLAKIAKSGNKEAKVEDEILRRIKAALDEGTPARQVDLSEDDLEIIKEMKAQSLCEFLIPTGGSIFDVVRDKVIDEYRINLAWMTCTHPDNYGKAWAQLSYDKIFGDNTAYGPMDYISAGVPLSVYNVDDDETMDAVIPYYPKLKAIFTNYPSKLIQKLRAQGYAD